MVILMNRYHQLSFTNDMLFSTRRQTSSIPVHPAMRLSIQISMSKLDRENCVLRFRPSKRKHATAAWKTINFDSKLPERD